MSPSPRGGEARAALVSGAWSDMLTPPAPPEMDRLDVDAHRRVFAALDRLAEASAGDLRKLAGPDVDPGTPAGR